MNRSESTRRKGARGSKYSGKTNAEICKIYRSSIDPAKRRKNEEVRKKIWRHDLKKNPEAYKKYLESERLRKNHANLLKKMSQHNDTLTSSSTSISTTVPESSSAIPATPTHD